MDAFRRRRRLASLEHALRAAAPQARPEFVEDLARRVEGTARRRARPRLRLGLAAGLAASFLASLAALGAPAYVTAAVSAVAQTAKATIAATAQSGGGNDKGGAKNDNGGNQGGNNQGGGGNNQGGGGDDGNDDDNHEGQGCAYDDDECDDDSGEGQYGHGIPICHDTHDSKRRWVLLVAQPSTVPEHRKQGDIIPAPQGGCPDEERHSGADDTGTEMHGDRHEGRVGDRFRFSVTITSTRGTQVDGAVVCLDNGKPFDNTIVVAGKAECADTFTASGLHTITTAFIPANPAKLNPSTSTSWALTLAKADSQTRLETSGSPSAPAKPVTFTATVAPVVAGGAAPTGAVQFLDGPSPLGAPVALDSSGVATLTTSVLAPGTHAITAAYTGDGTYAVSTGPVSQKVGAVATTTTLVPSQSTAAVGQTVTYTVTVASDGVQPLGTVQLFDGATQLGSATVGGTISAALATAGTHSLTAVFTSGDAATWTGSTSAPVSVTAQKTSTSVTLASSANSSPPGAAVTFTATVTPAQRYAAPTGTVQFAEGATPLGTGTLGTGGTATFSTSSLSTGTHSITATYAGDPAYAGSTSAALVEAIQAVATSLTYTGATAGTAGKPLMLAAAIAGAPAGSPVVFTYPGGTANGVAGTPLTIVPTWTGTKTVTVSYPGDATHLPSTTPASVTVSAPASIALTSSANPSAPGQNVVFTAALTASGAPLPAGAAIAFSDGGAALGTVPVDGAGKATLTAGTLSAGVHTIAATYAGDAAAFVLGASATVTQTVTKPATAIAYAGPSSVTQGRPAAFGAALTGIPDGSPVVFTFPGGASATGTASANAASVTVTPDWTPASGTTVTIAYAGDAGHAPSSAIGTVTIAVPKQSATTTSLAASPNPVASGSTVTFTATVTAADGSTPAGTVSFYDNGLTPFASAVPVNGVATVSAPAGAVGSHLVGAAFAPADGKRHASSTSSIGSLVVTKPTVTVALASSSNPVVPGANVTFTATVSPPALAGAVPTGTVTFKAGTTTLGSATLNGGTASVTTKTLAVGFQSITAAYGGDVTYDGATSGALSQSVAAAGTTAAYTGPATATYGQPLAITASVPGAPAGASVTVTYPGGSSSLAIDETLTVTPTWIGPGSIKIAYLGDQGHLPSSATATVVASAPTTLTLASSANPAPVDAPVKLSATITTAGASLPAGSVVSFFDGATSLGSATVTAGQASLTVGTLTAGTHSLSVSFAGNPGLYVLPGLSSLSETIVGLPTTVAYTGPSTTYGGVPITLTAATTGIPNGSVVTFTLPGGGTVNGTVSGNAASATTTVGWSVLAGSTVGVGFAGDARRAPSTAAGTLRLFTRAVGVAVSSSANPVPSSQSITYTVTVSSNEVANPQGSITVYDNGAPLGTRTLSATGTASVAVTAGSVGTHSVTAAYASTDTGKWASATSPALTQTITKPAVTVSIGSSGASVEPGAQVTITATVLPVVRVTATPTGTVQFLEGSTVLGSATISASGTASFSTSGLSVGSHSITASYSGDATYDASSSGALAQTVGQRATATKLTATPQGGQNDDGNNQTGSGQGGGGQLVQLAVAVTAKGAPMSGGNVTFTADGITLGSVPVSGGQASYTVYRLAAGSHTVGAQYSPPSADYAASSDSASVSVR